MNFKILAIRPLKDCHKRFTKNLKPGRLYKFYQEYIFSESRGIITNIEFIPKVPEKWYCTHEELNNKPDINISAVVGPNGSGKSTLFELIYGALYIIATSTEVIVPNLVSLAKDLKRIQDRKAHNKGQEGDAEKVETIKRINSDIKRFAAQFKCELYYEIGNIVYCIRINNKGKTAEPKFDLFSGSGIKADGQITKYKLQLQKNFNFGQLFYGIGVNYSIHGLNSRHCGDWIEYLFHKNDGYQTPLVINPMRDEGTIDINVENHLAQSRLLANLASQSLNAINVVEDKTVFEIEFALNTKMLDSVLNVSLDNAIQLLCRKYETTPESLFDVIYKSILKEKGGISPIKAKQIPNFRDIVNYAIKKIIKIAYTYDDYRAYSEPILAGKPPVPSIADLPQYLRALSRDKSHITLKLRQILNVVKFNYFANTKSGKAITVSIARYQAILLQAKDKSPKASPIELVPAAFYDPVIHVSNNSSMARTSSAKFYLLSSGELQLVHSIHSILYHLNNLESVFETEKNSRKKKYRQINIMLDEIELYFHPAFQQKLLDELLRNIAALHLKHIRAVNIMCATHSPFILSDIPSQNVLRVEGGEPSPSPKQTFGANIHQMLHDDFFLENGYNGARSKKVILDLITDINAIENAKLSAKSVSNLKRRIDIVGEPFIATKLREILERAVKTSSNDKD